MRQSGNRPRGRRSCTALLGALACGCAAAPSPPSDEQVALLIAADACFGGGAAIERHLRADPTWVVDESKADVAFLTDRRAHHDARAAARVRTALTATEVETVLAFLHTDAGRALLAAEEFTAAAIAQVGDFPRDAAAIFCDPTQVGRAIGSRRLQAAGVQLAAHALTISPHVFARQLGAMLIDPIQAPAIAAFLASPTGRRWMDARVQAFAAAAGDYSAFGAEARSHGFAMPSPDVNPQDLILPRATGEHGR